MFSIKIGIDHNNVESFQKFVLKQIVYNHTIQIESYVNDWYEIVFNLKNQESIDKIKAICFNEEIWIEDQ